MIPRERSFWGALLVVLYVCAAHLRIAPESVRAWSALALGPGLLVLGWRAATAPAFGADWIHPAARRAGQACAAGLALVVVAELGPDRSEFLAVRTLGLGLALTSASVAVSRIAALGGTNVTREPRNDAPIATGLLWAAALGLAVARAAGGDDAVDTLTVDYAVVAASLGALGIATIASFRVFTSRRFELGVAERAAGALWLGVLSLAIGALAALMEVTDPERIVPIAALVAAAAATGCAVSQRPATVALALRHAASVTMVATPLMSVAVIAAYKAPTHAGAIVFVVTVLAVGLGVVAPRIAERMAPEKGRTKRVLEQAIVAAKAPEPRQAVTQALAVIRDGLGADHGPAALHRFATADRLIVDRAGYLHVEPGLVPDALVERAASEPERVVGVEVLRAVEVREVHVGAMITWLDERGAGAAALVLDEEVPIGMLLWPAAGRIAPLVYEEILALRSLADHLGVAAGAEARLDQSRERAIAIERGMGEAAKELQVLRARTGREGARLRAAVEFLGERAGRALYSPMAQMTATLAERLAEGGESLVVVQQPGGDALSWAARVHLASTRRDGLFLVVDCTRHETHSLEFWLELGTSPLEVARGGTLVLADLQGLPPEAQRTIGTSVRGDLTVIGLAPRSPAELTREGVIEEHLARLFGERVLDPPPLAARSEDLRALALMELTRLGSRLRGRPMGLALDAQQELVEYEWPGNEGEFEAVLLRAALRATGEVVTREVLVAAMLGDAANAPRDSGPVRVSGGAGR
ncbi:MAG: hypothetical protein FJ096_17320 [Deltaproteobacteria bacterium]|nr:hypothetical protein [Deltaproteobacteria bacterium]